VVYAKPYKDYVSFWHEGDGIERLVVAYIRQLSARIIYCGEPLPGLGTLITSFKAQQEITGIARRPPDSAISERVSKC
jgi:hypothetical protein